MTDKNTAALAAHHPERHIDMVGRWYMVNRDGMATLCADREDAEKEAADAIDRLMPELSTWALAAGALQLDQLLASTAGMGTADVRRALKRQEEIT